ncbi:MAG TPA: hypothetical protein DEP05_06735 [Betaproteobacteria bacterium]|nr:hypothetical protein [Betaproteobacteria bacterium]
MKAYQNIKNSKTPYPICLHGVISKITSATKDFKYPKIKLHSPYVELRNGKTPVRSIELLIADEKFDLNEFAEDQEILVYGLIKIPSSSKEWIPSGERDKEEPKKIIFLNMNVWINHNRQIAKLRI